MKIFIAHTPTEAHMAQQQLQSNNIACEVRGESLFSLRGEVPFDESTLPYVWLLDNHHISQAKEILKNWQQSLLNTEDKENWCCQQCLEENEAQFDICWNCMHPKP